MDKTIPQFQNWGTSTIQRDASSISTCDCSDTPPTVICKRRGCTCCVFCVPCCARISCNRFPKCSWPPTLRCFTCWSLCISLFLLLFISSIAIGIAIEMRNVSLAPDTNIYYTMPQVCVRKPGLSGDYVTMDNRSIAIAEGYAPPIAHCGPCGKCSTDQDLAAYQRTASTLTSTVTQCALRVLFSGPAAATQCMNEKVGLTSNCQTCWTENIVCDQRLCVLTCLYSLIKGEKNNRDAAPGDLSACLQCDEKLCGPAFVQCAGANRRRCGITSDIGRSSSQLCNLTSLT
jgi:hypothetical protein